MSDPDSLRYTFGRNWARFEQSHFSESRVEIAKAHLLRFLRCSDLRGSRFLDIGSGSGIHSLAAHRAGAECVVSFDYDTDSVATTTRIWEREGRPDNWTVGQGSVLDPAFMKGLAEADVVYSWGVLHHTGDVWTALRNATIPLAPSGLFYIALYASDVYVDPTPEYWIQLKRTYNRAGALRRRYLEAWYAARFVFAPELRRGRWPLTVVREFQESRGMSLYTDVKDWLGGYPMEFTGNAETIAFAEKELGLEILNVSAGPGNTEYLFRIDGARNAWDDVLEAHPAIVLERPYDHDEGCAWSAALADSAESVMLYEDGVPQGYTRETHRHVQKAGKGRFHRRGDRLYFSSSDNSDPNSNGRVYSVRFGMGE